MFGVELLFEFSSLTSKKDCLEITTTRVSEPSIRKGYHELLMFKESVRDGTIVSAEVGSDLIKRTRNGDLKL
jgi:hypothetical protein